MHDVTTALTNQTDTMTHTFMDILAHYIKIGLIVLPILGKGSNARWGGGGVVIGWKA